MSEQLTIFTLALLDEGLVLDVLVTGPAVVPGPATQVTVVLLGIGVLVTGPAVVPGSATQVTGVLPDPQS